jgi:hypothetical protein
MPKILAFKGDISRVHYSSFENKSSFSEEPIIYLCNVTIREVGRGLARAKFYHNASLQMIKEEWDKKLLEKGDRIEILDNATWHADTPVEYTVRNKEKLKKLNKSVLQKDKNGYTVGKMYAYPYSIRCKPNQWRMICKFTEQNYCTIFGSSIKLPLNSKVQFLNENELSWYIDKNEFETLLPLQDEQVRVISYSTNQKKAEKIMLVTLQEETEIEQYYLKLNEIKE